ncbi:MAG: hypothetical protein MdMp014T_1797 [Treponematales bacterium]
MPKWKNNWGKGKKDFAERRTDGGKGTADFRPGRRGFRDAGGDGETAEHRAGAAKGQGAKGTTASRTGALFPARRAVSCPTGGAIGEAAPDGCPTGGSFFCFSTAPAYIPPAPAGISFPAGVFIGQASRPLPRRRLHAGRGDVVS